MPVTGLRLRPESAMVSAEVAFHTAGREQYRTIGDPHDGRRANTLRTHIMEDHMTDLMHAAADVTPRRGFFTRMAGAMALGLAGFASTPLRAQTAAAGSNGPNWPGALKGRNRQVVDAYEVNSGFPLAFVYTFTAPNDPSDTYSCAGAASRGIPDRAQRRDVEKIQDRGGLQNPRSRDQGAGGEESFLQAEARRAARRRTWRSTACSRTPRWSAPATWP